MFIDELSNAAAFEFDRLKQVRWRNGDVRPVIIVVPKCNVVCEPF